MKLQPGQGEALSTWVKRDGSRIEFETRNPAGEPVLLNGRAEL